MLTAVYGTDDARTTTVRVDGSRRRTEHSGTDPEFAAVVLARAGNGRDVAFESVDEQFRFRYRTRRDGRVSMVSVAIATGFSGVFEPSGRVMVAWSRAGGVRITTGTSTRTTRPGVPVLLPMVGPFRVTAPAGSLQLLSIDRVRIETELPRWVRLAESGREAPRAALLDLRSCIETVAAVAADDHSAPDLRRDTEAALVATVLRTFGEHTPEMAMPSTVELAGAYLEEHYDRTLALTDICKAVGVSPRTLQTAFMQHHGVSPMVFLQGLRLDHARQALRAADWRTTSVAEIAHDCGFRHMGRFSGSYHRRFEEYPAQTLRDWRHAAAESSPERVGVDPVRIAVRSVGRTAARSERHAASIG